MGLENASYVNDLVTTNPVGSTDYLSEGDDHIRLLKSVLKNSFPGLSAPIHSWKSFVSGYDVVAADSMRTLIGTGNLYVASPSTFWNGFTFQVYANGGDVTVIPSSGGINGESSLVLAAGTLAQISTNGSTYVAGMLVSPTYNFVPPGVIAPYAGTTEPSGWLLCYGQAVSRTTYARLFAAIGTTYGAGDGTTFNLPDLRGRAAIGRDNMGGTAASRVTSGVSGIDGVTLGAAGGSQHLQSHNHGGVTGSTSVNHRHSGVPHAQVGSGGYSGATYFSGDPIVDYTGYTIEDTTHTHSIPTAGNGSSQNMPPSLVLNYIIKF